MDAAEVWRETVCCVCRRCHRLLALLEGPLCDGCLNRSEMLPEGVDKWERYRNGDADRERFEDDEDDDCPKPSTGRDLFAVNLETGEFVRLPRTPAT